jgi:SAM-dependent methyltransferase
MRTTWDAAATSEDVELYVGDPATGASELEGLFGRLGDDPRGGVCVEIGCGPGRMTGHLAERFDRVIAVDVSSEMLARARAAVRAPNVDFRLVSGERLEEVEDSAADTLVCYLVLQHLPSRRIVLRYLRELARVLARTGRAYVQIPVLGAGGRPRAWRLLRTVVMPLERRWSDEIGRRAAYRGYRLTGTELENGLAAAGLKVTARDESPESPYRYASEVFLRLERSSE